jgi:Protein of unknown function DUF262/Protein of unknown function (DUF1524)
MSTSQLDPKLRTIGELFDDSDAVYTVPVYQRNYTWRAEQIEQLISDIQDAIDDDEDGYFLGNLIVTERSSTMTDYEVIDGQQRLTTLYLLLTFLADAGAAPHEAHKDRLRYESRPRATEALRLIATGYAAFTFGSASGEDTGIHQGFNVIQQYMDQHISAATQRARFADFLREHVTVVRASLPPKTDLNRYFEIMNTRGQQLQQVDIVKARLMSDLENDAERGCFAWIWDACANMDSYVQMSLARGDTSLREKIFGGNWSQLTSANFQELLEIRESASSGYLTSPSESASLTLDEALKKYAAAGHPSATEDQDNVRFRSIIEFPVFLLHVLKVKNRDDEEQEGHLDDKLLIRRFSGDFGDERAQWVRDFAFELLRARNLFDSFILKRQFTATNGDDGDWSLRRIIRRTSRGRATPGYINTFSGGGTEVEEDGEADPATNDLLLLQSMLRITYTSPRTMHWITKLLKLLAESQSGTVSGPQLAAVLRDYARTKVNEAFFAGAEPTGFGISRIVFTYLDYLLLTGRPEPDFRFSFRNSIEHFYPQHPDEQQSGAVVSPRQLDLLGNLALVSVGANSKFSNSLPGAKAENFRTTIEAQSPKLQKMARITREQGWGDAHVLGHHKAMVELLRGDLGLWSATSSVPNPAVESAQGPR